MIVTDTNVVAALFLPSPSTSNARTAFQRDSDWLAPLLWRSEFRKILAGYLRRKTLSLVQALRLAQAAERFFAGRELPVRSDHVLDLAWRSGCSAYNCEFVAAAEDAGVRLVTLDQEVLAAFAGRAVSLGDFAAGL